MISSDGDNAPGTVYYGLAMSIMASVNLFVPDMIIPFGIGVFCTSLGDGFAGLFGQLLNFPKNVKIYGNKTLYGCLYNFLICILVVAFFNVSFSLGMKWWHCLVVAVFATELELFTGRGLDNITITLGSSFLAYFLLNFEQAGNYLVPILLTPLIIVFAKKKEVLTTSGIIAAFLVDIVISFSLKNSGFILLSAFLSGGIIVDKIKKKNKKTKQNEKYPIEKRGECRDHVQVLANSFVATIFSLLYVISKEEIFVLGFVASLAEAMSDTAASGIGLLSGKAYDVFRMKKCEAGLSGGVSLLGSASSLVGALVIATLSFALGLLDSVGKLFLVTFAAFLGALFDSMLGSLLQIKYKCKLCGTVVEREEHCGEPTEKYSGIRIVNNDVVNFLGTLFSALICVAFYTLQ